jgi:predicted permease
MSLIAICSYMAFLATNLTVRNVNTRTKNTRTRRKNLIRAWTRLIMATASFTSFKIRASIVRVATVDKHGIRTIKTTHGTMETPMMTVKTPTKSR